MKQLFSQKNLSNATIIQEFPEYELTDEQLHALQDCIRGIYADVFALCEKYGLKLILTGGTLLGKVRHDGFIPWDDDMDLCMFRDDYRKLAEVFDEELGDRYRLYGPHCKDGCAGRFYKVYKKGTLLDAQAYNNAPKEVSIDIFPLDFVPEERGRRDLKGAVSNGLLFITSSMETASLKDDALQKKLNQTGRGRINFMVRSLVAKVFSFRSLVDWYRTLDDFVVLKKRTRLCTSAMGSKHYIKEILPTKVFEPLQKTEFLGVGAYMPHRPERYLQNLYGDDYMTVPPKEKRARHMIRRLEL